MKINWNEIHGMKNQRGVVARINGWRFHRIIQRFATICGPAVFSVEVYAPKATESDEIWLGMTADDIDAEIIRKTA